MDWFYFIVSALAVWRLTHLLAKEDGPFDVIFLLRKNIRRSVLCQIVRLFLLPEHLDCPAFRDLAGPGLDNQNNNLVCFIGAACLLEQGTTKNEGPKQAKYHED